MFEHTTKLIMNGIEHTAIPTKDLEDLYKRAYQKGYNDGFQEAYGKVFWDDGK